ncbi:hypothetical protein DRN38_00050 [Thermococci archaeon]|nr:MAG: hypothetical protein DRN38_00050 [Thermococci archaeon]
MRGSKIHLILMYVTEGLTIALIVLWLMFQRIELLLFSLMMLIITCTEHVLYLLSSIYEKLENLIVESTSLLYEDGD